MRMKRVNRYYCDFCKKAGLVPPEVRVYMEKGENKLQIPRLGWDRHTVYTILSLYRHADCHPHMVMKAVLLYQKLKQEGVSFLQCLHYALAEYGSPNSGHTFINMSTRMDYEANCGGLNLAAGVALARFARMSIGKRGELQPIDQTLPAMCKLVKDLNPIRPSTKEVPSYYSANSTGAGNGIGTPTYILKSRESILLPKFAPLYENPDLTPEEFAAAVKEDCK